MARRRTGRWLATGMALLAAGTAGAAVQVFNTHVIEDPHAVRDPGPPQPVVIVGARNGTFSGAVAVASDAPITGLRATVRSADVAGARRLPPSTADEVTVRYAMPWTGGRGLPPSLDILLETAPEEVPVRDNRALVGIWVTVSVPEATPAGIYRGTLHIEADGLADPAIPVVLHVADWVAPDPSDWRTWIEMIQSPDTLALEYEEPLWSDRHFDLIARSFRLIRPTGSRVVYIPILRETNQGNRESMVRWIRGRDGGLRPDFSVMERYLDAAQANLGDVRMVIFYVWDAYLVRSFRNQRFDERPPVTEPEGTYNHGQQMAAVRRWEMRQGGLMVTIIDEATGEVEAGRLPHYTAEGSREIWQPFYAELRERMRRRGLEDAMMLGMVTDLEPERDEVEFLEDVTGGLPWVSHSHFRRTAGRPAPNTVLRGVGSIAYEAHAYSLAYHVHPDQERSGRPGWQIPELRAYLCRFGELNGPALRVRQMPMLNITGRQRGVGRLGGDFWSAVRDRRGMRSGMVFARYPHNHWRGLNLNSYFLAPGPDGAVATARLENLREGVQECEARILVEEALGDPEIRARLGDALAARARAAMDAYHLAIWRSHWPEDEHLPKLGTIEGRSIHEAIWGGLGRAGVSLPGFWDGEARNMRGRLGHQGLTWFVQSDWQARTSDLFEMAAEVQRLMAP